jgi:putative ABC transport system permease protein
MFDTFQEIWGAIQRNRLRTIATGFAVASGIFLLIVLQGASNGIINTLEINSGNLAFDILQIWGGTTSIPHDGMQEGRRIRLEEEDMNIGQDLFSENVTSTTADLSQGSLIASVDKNYMSVSLTGVYPEFHIIENIEIKEGRFINNIDMQKKRKIIVISDDNAKSFFKDKKSPINRYIKIGGINYKVVGLYKKNTMFSDNNIYAPYTTVQSLYNKGKYINSITLKTKGLDDEIKNLAFETKLRNVFSQKHDFSAEDRRAIWIRNSASQNAQMSTASSILSTSFWILGMLTLISGIVGVSNIMLIAVKERTQEFGIRKALGAKPWNIIRMIILESIFVTTIFGYIGMFIGIAFCEYMDATVGNQTLDIGIFQQEVFINPTVDISTCIRATIIIIIAGAIAGFIPAQKAAKVKPIEALRG